MKHVNLITLKTPCSSCFIITNLIKEMFNRFESQVDLAKFNIIELDHPKQAYSIEGLEVEKLPAIIIDGEQITAGSLPNPKYLLEIIKE